MSAATGMVTVHWYSDFEITVMLVRVATFVLAPHEPTGPHVMVPVLPDLSVAQLIVIDVWIESVRYG